MKKLLLLTAVILLFFGCGSEEIPEDDVDNSTNGGVDLAKGAIIGYIGGWHAAASDKQLDLLTHLIVFQVHPNPDGSLDRSALAKWLNKDYVRRAQERNVKVSVAIGGWVESGENKSPGSAYWVSATNEQNREKFVDNLVALVNEFELDGLDIDWEYPQGVSGWTNFMKLCNELRAKLPGKRLSTALPGRTPNDQYYTAVVREQIWEALDAIQLMSYDMCSWETHSDAYASNKLIDDWAEWGKNSNGFDKRKLVLGCAFYPQNCGGINSPGDTPESLKEKVGHCYDNGYGGVMIWEIGHNKPELLSAIYDATQAKGGYKK